MAKFDSYNGNTLLKGSNVPIHFTENQIKEFLKCQEDPIYFCETYIKIVNIDEGLVPFKPRPYQKKMIRGFSTNRYTITKMPRQSGKSVAVVAFLLWKAIFYDYQTIGILAHKGSTARELLSRVKLAYQNLPKWLQQGVEKWNEGDIKLENGSTIIAESTSSDAIRGFSFNLIFLDEFAFIPRNLAEAFFASVYPTITSGKKSQVIIVSTPNGMNHYYKMWQNAIEGNNDYIPIEVHWSEVPGRDENWKKETIRNTSEAQFAQEFDCQFMGGLKTLINPAYLATIPFIKPIETNNLVDIFEQPKDKHTYFCTVDVSRGVQSDYSAFLIIDVTTLPYKVVCKYRSKDISPSIFPVIIHNALKKYNNAFCLVEINDIGGQVSDTLFSEFEYDNMIVTVTHPHKGQMISSGFAQNMQVGMRTTAKTKNIGCSMLKTMVEASKLIINDIDIIEELSAFTEQKNTFAAEEGGHDDLCMCLVIFAWATNQPYFKDVMDINIRQKIQDSNMKQIEDSITPFGLIDDHADIESEFNALNYDDMFRNFD